jgi:hypothetical protein
MFVFAPIFLIVVVNLQEVRKKLPFLFQGFVTVLAWRDWTMGNRVQDSRRCSGDSNQTSEYKSEIVHMGRLAQYFRL